MSRHGFAFSSLALACALATTALVPLSAAAGPVAARTPKVLFIGTDGFRGDVYGSVATPNLDALVADGYLGREGLTADTAISGTGWSSLFTGVERDKHGVYDNSFSGKNYAAWPDVLSRIEAVAPGKRTAAAVAWSPLATQIPWRADSVFDAGSDAKVLSKALEWLGDAAAPDVLLLDFNEPDGAGHAGAYFNRDASGYTAAIRGIDASIGKLMAALRARPNYANEDWLIIVGTDHGGSVHHGHNTPEDRKILIAFSGDSVPDLGLEPLRLAPRQVDVAPSILAHLGLAIPSGLDGRPMHRPTREAAPALGINLLANGDAEYSVGRIDRAYDSDVPGWRKGRGGQAVEYARYTWLPAPPAGAGRNLFIGRDTGKSNTLSQRVDLRGLDLSNANFALSANLGAASGHRARVFLRFYDLRGMASFSAAGVGHVFRGGDYYKYDIAADRVVSGYPQPIATNWPGLETFAGGARNLDAAVDAGNGEVYFFKDAQYVRYDLAAGAVDAGYPAPIAGRWPGLEKFAGGARDLDAALFFSRSKLYFFKGDQYIRYNLDSDRADSYYPAYLSESTWPNSGYWPAHWSGALNFASGKSYVFKPGEYLRYDRVLDRADAGYPAPITASNWPGLQALYAGSAFELAPGGGNGAFQRYELKGSVPQDAQWAEVEIRFEHGNATGDAFADNLSLILQR
ncbi:hemopexin repeat-containing protein [Lysobacter sp. Hz 25]|uniref:hemopexin repeat-containing protein n=1 Tax=Lysobacter sp. Hz 25 TaxID=3383698 RepID=UPI0038D50A2C